MARARVFRKSGCLSRWRSGLGYGGPWDCSSPRRSPSVLLLLSKYVPQLDFNERRAGDGLEHKLLSAIASDGPSRSSGNRGRTSRDSPSGAALRRGVDSGIESRSKRSETWPAYGRWRTICFPSDTGDHRGPRQFEAAKFVGSKRPFRNCNDRRKLLDYPSESSRLRISSSRRSGRIGTPDDPAAARLHQI